MKKSTTPYHDLTRIRGIGEARQRILRQIFNISYYSELAELDIDKTLAAFRKMSEAVSREMLEVWIEEARILNAEWEALIASGGSLKMPEAENGWQAFATFVVDYQEKSDVEGKAQYRTTVHHIQTDTTKTWKGLESVRYHQWINQRFDEAKFTDLQNNNKNRHSYSATIQNISFKHASGGKTSDQTNAIHHRDSKMAIKSKHFTDIELLLQIEGHLLNKQELNKVQCKIRCLVQKHGQDEYEEFNQTSPLHPAKHDNLYLSNIENIFLEPGEYRFWISVVLNSQQSIPHFRELPHVSVKETNE